MHNSDRAVQSYEAGETWNDDDEVVDIEVRRPLDKVIPIRLPSDKWEALRREAQELGIGPTTLARMWLLERLRSVTLVHGQTPEPSTTGKPRSTGRRTLDRQTAGRATGARGDRSSSRVAAMPSQALRPAAKTGRARK
jgi:hypothetical protein